MTNNIKEKKQEFETKYNELNEKHKNSVIRFSNLEIADKTKRPDAPKDDLVECNKLWYEFLGLQKEIRDYLFPITVQQDYDKSEEITVLNIKSILHDVETKISQLSSNSSSLSNQTAILSAKYAVRIARWSIAISFLLFILSIIFSVVFTISRESRISLDDFHQTESSYQQSVSNKLDSVNSKIQALQESLEKQSKIVNDRLDSVEATEKNSSKNNAQKQ